MPANERAHALTWAQRSKHQNQYSPSTGLRIEDLEIRNVWDSLGLGPLRGNRGRASWRDGAGYNVALDSGRWFDHARGEGGGVLALVEIVLGCDRHGALDWLKANFGITSGNTCSVAERREFAARRDLLRAMAARLIDRRDDYCFCQLHLAHFDALIWPTLGVSSAPWGLPLPGPAAPGGRRV